MFSYIEKDQIVTEIYELSSMIYMRIRVESFKKRDNLNVIFVNDSGIVLGTVTFTNEMQWSSYRLNNVR